MELGKHQGRWVQVSVGEEGVGQSAPWPGRGSSPSSVLKVSPGSEGMRRGPGAWHVEE